MGVGDVGDFLIFNIQYPIFNFQPSNFSLFYLVEISEDAFYMEAFKGMATNL